MTALSPSIIQQITDIVGKEFCTTRTLDLHCYSFDSKGIIHMPDAVAHPGSTEEVAAILKLASTHRFPVIARGAGSNRVGACVPVEGGLILAMTRMNKILEIDAKNGIAIVEPGVINLDLQKAAGQQGLFFGPDPASFKYATIGGNAAAGAGGPSAVKYGVTKDSIIGLEVVLASGEIINAGVRTEKGVVGYDLVRLFIGSEGTLGIITKLICRLLPLPEKRETFLFMTESMSDAAETVSAIINAGIKPRTLEYLDKTAISVVADIMPIAPSKETKALLIIELDGKVEEVARETEKLTAFMAGKEGIQFIHAQNAKDVDDIWQARRSLSPASLKIKPHKISEDIVVPRARIPELVAFLEDLGAELDLSIITYGHAGDGNIHVGIMIDKSDKDELARGESAKKRLFSYTLELGGTLSGEHGVGMTKSSFIEMELSAATIACMESIKKSLDPYSILNPGKIFPSKTKSVDK